MDPYSVLGISRSATPEEIRRVFRKLAAKYHPDRNPGDSKSEKLFKEASAAYELLMNPRKSGQFHTQPAAPPPPPTIVPVVIRGGRKKAGARRGYMPPRTQVGPQPQIKPGASYTVRSDVKLGSVPLKDLPPWMAKAPLFGQRKDPLDRGKAP